MIARLITVALLATLLPAGPIAAPQTAAELLQRGIYTQETVGDLDGAIRIYRELLNSRLVPRQYAAQAQYRLADCLFKKRDFARAAQEFKKVVQEYSDFRELASRATAQAQALAFTAREGAAQEPDGNRGLFQAELRRLGLDPPLNAPHAFGSLDPVATSKSIGDVQNGRYHHNWTGVEFDVPDAWLFFNNSLDLAGEIANLFDSRLQVSAWVWLARQTRTQADIAQTLATEAPRKAELRQEQGFKDWIVRPGSIWYRMIGSQQAVTIVADYTEAGQQMVEYMTWICSEKNHAQFHVRGPLSDLQSLQMRLEPIIESAVVP